MISLSPSPARRAHGSLKSWLLSLAPGTPVRVCDANEAANLKSCAWRAGLRATFRKPSAGSSARIFTILPPATPSQ